MGARLRGRASSFPDRRLCHQRCRGHLSRRGHLHSPGHRRAKSRCQYALGRHFPHRTETAGAALRGLNSVPRVSSNAPPVK